VLNHKRTHTQDPHFHIETTAKPLLRGQFHAVAALLMIYGTWRLWELASPQRAKQWTLLIYGLSSVAVFACSAVYHIVHWSPPMRQFMRQLDHAMIFILIAGTYTPLSYNLLDRFWRILLLVSVWSLGLTGVFISAFPAALKLPRHTLLILYLLAGWVCMIAAPQVYRAVGWRPIGALASAGVMYSIGGLFYALKRPNIWPDVLGYHELFHLATIAANGIFYVCMLKLVIPLVPALET